MIGSKRDWKEFGQDLLMTAAIEGFGSGTARDVCHGTCNCLLLKQEDLGALLQCGVWLQLTSRTVCTQRHD